jgi:hypothetical protein
MVLQEMVRRLALNRLHDPTRRQVGWHAQQQMHMFWPHMALQNLDIERPTNLPNEIPHLRANVPHQYRLAILRDEHEVVVQAIDGMGGSTILGHRRASYRKPPEGVA